MKFFMRAFLVFLFCVGVFAATAGARTLYTGSPGATWKIADAQTVAFATAAPLKPQELFEVFVKFPKGVAMGVRAAGDGENDQATGSSVGNK